MYDVHFRRSGISPGNTRQLRIWRSSGKGQGYRSIIGREFIFEQCNTSSGHNSASIKHSMGYSGMADRMVWLPSLSRDRKWPCLSKFTYSLVVGLELKGNLTDVEFYFTITLEMYFPLCFTSLCWKRAVCHQPTGQSTSKLYFIKNNWSQVGLFKRVNSKETRKYGNCKCIATSDRPTPGQCRYPL